MTKDRITEWSLVGRVAASLAAKPTLRAALAAARPRDKPRLSHLLRGDEDGVRHGVLVRQRGFHLALMFGERTSVTWRTYDGSSDGDPAEVAESLFRYGVPYHPAMGDAVMRNLAPAASRAPYLLPSTVEAIEDAEDDATVIDGMGRLSDALHLATLAGVRRRLLAQLDGERRDLVAALLDEPRDLDAGMALAVHVASGVERPGWVLQALMAAPFLESLLWPSAHCQADRGAMLGRLAAGHSPFHVARDVLGLPATAPAALLRSVGNLPADGRMAADAAVALSRFHADHPRHRHLDPGEARNVAEAVPVVPSPTVARHLLDGVGRVAPVPAGLRDALASLGDSLEAIGGHLPGGFLVARHARDRVAFPSSRRHPALVRIDRDWHASVGRHEAALSALRDESLSAGTLIPEGEYPHLARDEAVLGDVRVVPLLTRADYLREGSEMRHCVGSYAGRAWAARIVGFSLRDAGGDRSTMTVEVAANGFLSQVEHKGLGNAKPSRAHAAAVDALVRTLKADGDALDKLLSVRAVRAKSGQEATTLPRDAAPDLVRRYLDLHFANVAHWLAPSEAAMGVEAWWAAVVARDAARPSA